MSVVLALARGTSVVTESIFDNRFRYVDELIRMGANIQVESNIAIINGIEQFSGTSVTVPDLRAGAALVIAGLAAQGVSAVSYTHLDVYKRQVSICVNLGWKDKNPANELSELLLSLIHICLLDQ